MREWAMGIVLRPENGLSRVSDASRRSVPFGHEKTPVIDRQARQLATQDQRLVELETELAQARRRQRNSGADPTEWGGTVLTLAGVLGLAYWPNRRSEASPRGADPGGSTPPPVGAASRPDPAPMMSTSRTTSGLQA